MNEINPRSVYAQASAPSPVGVIKAESPLARLWRNRLVPLKTVRPIRMLSADLTPGGFAHVVDLADEPPEALAALVALVPDLAPDFELLAQMRECWVPETHFEAVV